MVLFELVWMGVSHETIGIILYIVYSNLPVIRFDLFVCYEVLLLD